MLTPVSLWHRNVSASCLAWRFLTIAMVTGGAFAREFVRLEVGYRSTLVCVSVAMHVRHAERQLEHSFSIRRDFHGHIRKSFDVHEHQRNRRSVQACALAPLSFSVLQATNEIIYSAFSLGLWNILYNDHNKVGGVGIAGILQAT